MGFFLPLIAIFVLWAAAAAALDPYDHYPRSYQLCTVHVALQKSDSKRFDLAFCTVGMGESSIPSQGSKPLARHVVVGCNLRSF